MANRKFLFVENEEISEEVLSVSSSAGAGDSGKLATLDANGKWDDSFLSANAISTPGAGIDITLGKVSIDLLDADSGLKLEGVGDAAELAIDFADTSVTADLDGTNDLKPIAAEDLYLNGANQGAKIIGVDPTNLFFSSATLLQDVLEDFDDAIAATTGPLYTVGAGGVTKGDLVYISANDTVLPVDPSTDQFGIGLCITTEAAAASVAVSSDDYILTGVLVGATAGDKYYWDGSVITATAPSGGGDTVWMVGVAKNATDLHVEVRRIKKNA